MRAMNGLEVRVAGARDAITVTTLGAGAPLECGECGMVVGGWYWAESLRLSRNLYGACPNGHQTMLMPAERVMEVVGA